MSDEQNIFGEENTNAAGFDSTDASADNAGIYHQQDVYGGSGRQEETTNRQSGQYTDQSNQQSGQYTDQPNRQSGQYTDQSNQQPGQYTDQSNRQYGGPEYQQYSYGQQYYNPYQQTAGGQKQGQGFGIASLVLGILSLVLFCTCINFLLGLLALIFGIIQIVRYEKKGLAIGGIVTSAVSFVLFFACWGMLMTSDEFIDTLQQDLYQYDEIYDEIYDDYYDEDRTL